MSANTGHLESPANAAPAVSIVMPVFNTELYLAHACRSVLQQSFGDFEFIIVDDGSTDDSLRIARGFERMDGRVKVISRPNTGGVRARHDGIKIARAPIIASMDSDDIAEPDRLALQVEYMNQHPECVVVGGYTIWINPEGDELQHEMRPLEHDAIMATLMSGDGGAIRHPAACFRREAILRVGGYDAQYSVTEDLDLLIRLGEIGRLANIPHVVLRYRQHPKSTNRTKYELQSKQATELLKRAMARRGEPVPEGFKIVYSDPGTEAAQRRIWAWGMLRAGRRGGAVREACRALRREPSLASLQTLACMIRGR